MKLTLLLVFKLFLIQSFAQDKGCLVQKSKECDVEKLPMVIPISMFISTSEKMNIQIAFKGLELDRHRDHLQLSSNECIIIDSIRDGATQKEQQEKLICSNITPGWLQANISITRTALNIGNYLNYSLDHEISYFVLSANHASFCQASSPTWIISNEDTTKIPLKGQTEVNLILESNEEFSPILEILGSSLPLSWNKGSIVLGQGSPLKKGKYIVSIFKISERYIFTVNSGNCENEADVRISNFDGPIDELSISITKGTLNATLNLNNTDVFCGPKEPPKDSTVPPQHTDPKQATTTCAHFAVIGFVIGAAIISLVLFILYQFHFKKIIRWKIPRTNNDQSKRYKAMDAEQPLVPTSDDAEKCGNTYQRTKVDRRKIIEEFTQPMELENKTIKTYKLKMHRHHHDNEKRVEKLSMGEIDSSIPTKTILLLGETGSGKSSSINAMVNYILGIEFKDEERFILIEENTDRKVTAYESQTDFMTAYVIPYRDGMPNYCNYVIIDTPGFSDTRGFERDQELMIQLKNFIDQEYDIKHIDIFGFVVKASEPRLTDTQRYLYDGLFSMFGNDINHNLIILATFAGAEDPPVLEVLESAGFEYRCYFKLNTNSLYLTNKENSETSGMNFTNQDRNKIDWERTENSLQSLFENISTIVPVSLSLTKVVLEENRRLDSVVNDLQIQINEGLNKIAELNVKQNRSSKSEETKRIEQDIKHTEELLINSIKEAQRLTGRLKEIPLRLDPLSIHGYIEKLIKNEEKLQNTNYKEKIQELEKLKDRNSILETVINKDKLPVDGSLLLHFQENSGLRNRFTGNQTMHRVHNHQTTED